jgi:hypothetical protein
MRPEQEYQHLENLAEQLGISIRYDDLGDPQGAARSGLCKLKGQQVFIMDSSKNLSERIRLLRECLSIQNLEGVYVLPAIREVLEGRSAWRKKEEG